MTTAQTDRWDQITGRIRIIASLIVVASVQLGFQVATAMWKPRRFCSFAPIFWGMFGAFWLFRLAVEFRRLHYAALSEYANTAKPSAQSMAYILCTALISFCFAICCAAAKSFGGLYIVAAISLGTLIVLMFFITDRKIKRLPSQFSHP
jgi:hypothetical protein